MALCEHCRAELERPDEKLPPPWFDHGTHEVAGVRLPPIPWKILEILYRRRDRVVSKDSLMTLLYSDRPDNPPCEKIIDVFICRLRSVLKSTPYSIRTQWAIGYQWLEPQYQPDRTA